jgi:hypothetical protein
MTTRERIICVVLAGFILVAGGGFLYYTFYAAPMASLEGEIEQAGKDVKKKLTELKTEKDKYDAIYVASPRLEQWAKISLPTGDSQDAEKVSKFQDRLQSRYGQFLDDQMRKAGFGAGGTPFTITPKELARKTGGLAGGAQGRPGNGKGPPYTAMSFTVQATGKYDNFVKMMEGFYKAPILHEIKNLTLEKAADSSRGKESTSKDLKATFIVEVLQVEGAEKRPESEALLDAGTGKGVPLELADGRYYREVLLKNDMFHGKPPPPKVEVKKKLERLKEMPELVRVETAPPKGPPREELRAVLGVIKLVQIAYNGKRWEAFYYDQGTGGADKMLVLGEGHEGHEGTRPERLREPPIPVGGPGRPGPGRPPGPIVRPAPPQIAARTFTIKDRYENTILKAEVINISTTRGIYFRADDHHIYRWGIGEFLDEAVSHPLAVVAEGDSVVLLKGIEEVDGLAIMSVGDVVSPFAPRPALGYGLGVGMAGLIAPSKTHAVTVASRNADAVARAGKPPVVEKVEEKTTTPEKPSEEMNEEEEQPNPDKPAKEKAVPARKDMAPANRG